MDYKRHQKDILDTVCKLSAILVLILLASVPQFVGLLGAHVGVHVPLEQVCVNVDPPAEHVYTEVAASNLEPSHTRRPQTASLPLDNLAAGGSVVQAERAC